jgi:3-hydroxybutyrate dehydrogenase/3-oxoacyl-[acyl-carrier protein] reductase
MKKIYVITGASSGIGYALCCHLARRHQHVIAIARRETALMQLSKEYPEYISILPADLAISAERERVIACICKEEKIAGLVNNAASVDPLSRIQDVTLNA